MDDMNQNGQNLQNENPQEPASSGETPSAGQSGQPNGAVPGVPGQVPHYGYRPPYQQRPVQPPYPNMQNAQRPVSPPPKFQYQYRYGRLNDKSSHSAAPGSIAPPPRPSKKGGGKRGLQIFAAVLAGVVLLAGVAGAGYWIGRGGRNLVQTDPTTSGQSDTTQHAAGGDIDLNIADGSDSQLDSRSAVASAVSPSVVGILTYSMSDTSAVSSASGVIMDEQGYIITNDHVYSDIPSARFIIITNEGKQYDAEFVAGDVRSDLAVLKADFKGDDVKPATFGKISTVKTGDQVLAIGSPGGILLADTVTSGIISATERWMSGQSSNGNTSYSMRCIQTDAAINPGNSGGALVNMQGQVIGIPSSKIVATGYEGIGFAIPVDVALNVAQSLVKNHYVADRAKLGVTYQTVSPVTAKQQNMRQGLYISTIDEESDLTEKGIESGDIILTADGKDAVLNNNMLSLIASKKPGDTVKLTIYKNRTGQTVTVNATLLADKGSSSYNTQAMETTTQNPFFPFR